jgi:hypothetical protein
MSLSHPVISDVRNRTYLRRWSGWADKQFDFPWSDETRRRERTCHTRLAIIGAWTAMVDGLAHGTFGKRPDAKRPPKPDEVAPRPHEAAKQRQTDDDDGTREAT